MQKRVLLAEGNTAEIYAWDDTHILKLFRPRYSQEYAEYEARMARAVHAAGIYSPAVSDIVEIDGRSGIIYTRVDGQTMTSYWLEKPLRRVLPLARQMAELQAAIHRAPITNQFSKQRTKLAEKIQRASRLSEATKQRVLMRLDSLPDGKSICHGDFHPENVLFTAQGAVVIDWIDATIGNPLGDVARTYILLDASAKAAPFSARKMFDLVGIRIFLFEYLRHYCRITGATPEAIRAWLPVIAAARLDTMEGATEQEEVLAAYVEAAVR